MLPCRLEYTSGRNGIMKHSCGSAVVTSSWNAPTGRFRAMDKDGSTYCTREEYKLEASIDRSLCYAVSSFQFWPAWPFSREPDYVRMCGLRMPWSAPGSFIDLSVVSPTASLGNQMIVSLLEYSIDKAAPIIGVLSSQVESTVHVARQHPSCRPFKT